MSSPDQEMASEVTMYEFLKKSLRIETRSREYSLGGGTYTEIRLKLRNPTTGEEEVIGIDSINVG